MEVSEAPFLDGELRPPGAWADFPRVFVLGELELGVLGPLEPVRGDSVEGAAAPAQVFCGARAERVNVSG